MAGKKRPVEIKGETVFSFLTKSSGATVCLAPDTWPDWAKAARDPKVDQILFWPHKGSQTGKTFEFHTADGRMTVLRYDPKDAAKGFPYNKDTYVIVCASDNRLWQFGPFSKGEPNHWMKDIPEEYEGWPVVSAKSMKRND